MKNPAYKIKIGSETFDSSTSQDIISLSVDSDLNVPSSSFKILVKPGTKSSAIKNGDAVVIEMGFEGSLKKVLTGTVGTIESKISGVMVGGLSIASILTSTRINQVYEQQTVGAIVKDIIGSAGISDKEVEDGLSFPVYVVDDTKNVYTHMRELALKCGFDLFLTGDGRLVFKKYARQTPKPFKYGRDIIEAKVYEPTPFASSVRVCGESPSSFKGADTAHVKSKKVVEGVAGNGNTTILIEDPTIRDKDTAQKVATAWLETFMTPLTGTLKVLGSSHVEPGDTIEIKEMPDDRMNGEFEVTAVNHIFNKNEGFVSIIDWAKKITISPTEPPLAAPPSMPSPPKPPSPMEEQLQAAEEQLEESRLELLDAVETAEMNLEEILAEINNAMAELEKLANEMIAAAEEVKEAAMEAAREALAKAEELMKEVEAKKKEIEDELAKAWEEYEKFKKEAMDQVNKFEQEIIKQKEEAKKKIDEIKSKVQEERKKVEDKIKEIEEVATGKLDQVKGEVENKLRELDEAKEEVLSKTGPARGEAEKVVAKLESVVNELKEKMESIEKEFQSKKQEVEDTIAKIKEKEEEIEKEVEEKIQEVDEKVREITDKKDELLKSVEDMEKQVKENAEKAMQKLEEMIKEVEDQINEFRQMAEDIEKEADEKFDLAREKVEETKKKAQETLEDVKKAYNEARDKVLEAREQVGLD